MKWIESKLENISAPKANLEIVHQIYQFGKKGSLINWILFFLIFFIAILFLPWTQNVSSKGSLTTRNQQDRPQELNSLVPGRVVKWNVKEGDFVQEGDIILQLEESKEEYLDPLLLQRTSEQIQAKGQSERNYEGKAGASAQQVRALEAAKNAKIRELDIKSNQQSLKVRSLQAKLKAQSTKMDISQKQQLRSVELYEKGLISLTDLETAQNKFQQSSAAYTEVQLEISKVQQEVARLAVEQQTVQQDYNSKISKSNSEQFQALSSAASARADAAKLNNQYGTYQSRRELFTVRAPQAGQIADARISGIGELIKQGEHIVDIIPDNRAFAAELFFKPTDITLLQVGQKVSLQFDGFPSIVFSGWPGASYGIFFGEVVAIEDNVNDKGLYRALVIPQEGDEKEWPEQLRMGTGIRAITLLNDVPVWYELWRNLNGFPPDFYSAKTKKEK